MRLLTKIVSIVVLCTVFTPSLFAIEYNKIGGRPAFPRDDNPRTQDIFIHTLEPGTVQDEGVKVINNTDEDKTILVYAKDSTPSTDGGFACLQFSQENKNVGSWIQLEKQELTVLAHSNEIIPFTISVPTSAGVGEHNGCILIQEKPTASGAKDAGINLSIRTGLRVAITVPGTIVQSLDFVDYLVQKRRDGSFLLSPVVLNTGNISIDANVDTVTRSIIGRVIQRHGGSFPILRGEESRWSFELKKPFWGGLFISRATITYLDSDGQNISLKSKRQMFFSFPTFWALLIEILILFILIILVLNIINRRKIYKWIRDTWVEYDVQPGEKIQKLSFEYRLPWKLVAKVNKIKPPYDISGATLLMPPPSRRKKPQQKK